MLSLFPQILFLAPLGVTLLRIAAAVVFLLGGYTHITQRRELSRINFMIIGGGVWIPLFTACIELAVGGLLAAGLYTQIAALFGALLALKYFVWKRRYSSFFPLSRTASALLFVICLSLIVSGAGALAFDLPL